MKALLMKNDLVNFQTSTSSAIQDKKNELTVDNDSIHDDARFL